MSRKYDVALLEKLKERTILGTYRNLPLVIKRVPEEVADGAMDPRLYQDSKKMLQMLKVAPNFLIKKMMNIDPEHIDSLREMFNAIKSVPVVETPIHIETYEVETEPSVHCSLYHYTDEQTTASSPVLYYIHGGGFFGGHHGVVEESLKLMVEKFHFHVFSIDYRLAPEHPYPQGHEDCYATLKWIYQHGKELNIDVENIFVAGDSAGGNLTQYCSTRDRREHTNMVKGQLLLYPTLNMCGVEDEYFKWDLSSYAMIPSQKRALTKMIGMFGSMSGALKPLMKVADAQNDDLNPYTRKDPELNPPTFVSVGEHDYLKLETLAWAAKLHDANVETKAVVYNGLGHAYFDNCGVFPQCEDCIEEMGNFIIAHAKRKED